MGLFHKLLSRIMIFTLHQTFELEVFQNFLLIGVTGNSEVHSMLRDYPWFHGTLSRTDASSLVLQEHFIAGSTANSNSSDHNQSGKKLIKLYD